VTLPTCWMSPLACVGMLARLCRAGIYVHPAFPCWFYPILSVVRCKLAVHMITRPAQLAARMIRPRVFAGLPFPAQGTRSAPARRFTLHPVSDQITTILMVLVHLNTLSVITLETNRCVIVLRLSGIVLIFNHIQVTWLDLCSLGVASRS
jgi:hypothetical protein